MSALLSMRGLLVPALLLLAAEVLVNAADLSSNNIAPPSAAFAALLRIMLDGTLFVSTGQTLLATAMGLAVGGSLGLVAGILLGLSRTASRLTAVSLEFFRPVPAVALIPISMLVFGFGYAMEVAVVAFAAFWPMLIYCKGAIEAVEPQLLEVAQMLRLSYFDTVRKIVLPAALPRIFVALRTATGIALILGVTTEILSNPQGLGFAVMSAQQSLNPDNMIANIFWLGVLGVVVNWGLLWLQSRLFGNAGRPGGGR